MFLIELEEETENHYIGRILEKYIDNKNFIKPELPIFVGKNLEIFSIKQQHDA